MLSSAASNFLSHPTSKRDLSGSNTWQMHKEQGRTDFMARGSFFGSSGAHPFTCVFCHVWKRQYLNLTSLELETKGQVHIGAYSNILSLKLTVKPTPFGWICCTLLIASLYLKLLETPLSLWHNLDVHSPIFITEVRKGNGRTDKRNICRVPTEAI